MIRFVDLKTGNLYNGDQPYIHWIEGQQSISLLYTLKLGVISDENHLNVSLPPQDVFSLIDTSKFDAGEKINGFQYQDIENIKVQNLSLAGELIGGYYFYIIYVLGGSNIPGEYIEELTINGLQYLIGVDLYNENESLKINLSNMGTEIVPQIQKAIYDTNVHEDYSDNIILNRKFKELLSNYWDIMVGRGSYRSLLDSLAWFEYGDAVKVHEIWRQVDVPGLFANADINGLLEGKYKNSLSSFVKTNYIALYGALDKLDSNYNMVEMIPTIEHCSYRWSVEELMMKMVLLGAFYKRYFMPIHLDLLHATFENKIFTNSVKIITDHLLTRHDRVCNVYDIRCNVRNNQEFIIDNAQVQVGYNTMFGTIWKNGLNYGDVRIVGVESDYVGHVTELDNECVITVTINNSTGGTVTGSSVYEYGDIATVIVIVNSNYNFLGWYRDGTKVSDNTIYSFEVTDSLTLEARVEGDLIPINVNVPEIGGVEPGFIIFG